MLISRDSQRHPRFSLRNYIFWLCTVHPPTPPPPSEGCMIELEQALAVNSHSFQWCHLNWKYEALILVHISDKTLWPCPRSWVLPGRVVRVFDPFQFGLGSDPTIGIILQPSEWKNVLRSFLRIPSPACRLGNKAGCHGRKNVRLIMRYARTLFHWFIYT